MSEKAPNKAGLAGQDTTRDTSHEPWMFPGWGLQINVGELSQVLPFRTETYSGLGISATTVVGAMDFSRLFLTSGNPLPITPTDMREALVIGVEDLQDFFGRIDAGKPQPEYLVGITNPLMARSAKRRLGFKISSLPGEESYAVMAKTTAVRDKLTIILSKASSSGRNRIDVLRNK